MKEGDTAIIRPVRGRKEPKIGANALMVMEPGTLASMARRTGAREWKGPGFAAHRLFLWEQDRGPGVAFAGPFLGAPHAVLGMEKLIALGARRIWSLGTCGSLSPECRIGDLVVPTGALSEEGTSSHYPLDGGAAPRSSPKMVRSLTDSLRGSDLNCRTGRVWTTDAPYRETLAKVMDYGSRGILAVEMEWSALLSVAAFRGVEMAGLLVVSDELFELKWNPGFGSPRLTQSLEKAGQIILRLAGGEEVFKETP